MDPAGFLGSPTTSRQGMPQGAKDISLSPDVVLSPVLLQQGDVLLSPDLVLSPDAWSSMLSPVAVAKSLSSPESRSTVGAETKLTTILATPSLSSLLLAATPSPGGGVGGEFGAASAIHTHAAARDNNAEQSAAASAKQSRLARDRAAGGGSEVEAGLGAEAGGGAEPKRVAWSLEDFELGDRLGSGAYGYVQLARERRGRSLAALKVLKKRRVQRLRAQRHVAREIDIQRHLRHPGILRLFGFFWDISHIYMILEYAPGGDLESLLRQSPEGRLDVARAGSYAGQVARALAYLHKLHVIHRDLKPQNVLFSRHGRPKLGDLGWAVHTSPHEQRWTLCGTLDYLAPEVVHALHGHSFGVDVWALGILAYEMSVGKPPFAARTHEETCRRILAASPTFPPSLASEAAEYFVVRLLQRDPSDRMQLEDAVLHPFTTSREVGSQQMVGQHHQNDGT